MPRTKRADQPAPATGHEGFSKTDAVRQALATMGRKAKPKAIQGFVKEHYGIDISINYVSNLKSGLKKKGRKQRAVAAAEPMAPVSVAANGRGRQTILSLTDIEITRQLADRIGVSQLHALIDLVAR